jgi:methyl-accepting chemotaxis protein
MELNTDQIKQLDKALDANTSSTQITLPKVSAGANNATSLNTAENSSPGAPSLNATIYASGNATTAKTGIKKSNETISHACDSSTYVGKIVKQAGAIGGKIVQAIRDAIKAIMTFFGVNPSSSGLMSKLKKLSQEVKDKMKFINDITSALQGYITYVNAIKQLISYILNLPARLLTYFADCVKTLQKQLVAGYQSALDATTDLTDTTSKDLEELKKNIDSIKQSVGALVTTAAAAAGSMLTLSQTPTGNTQAQAEATKEVFTAAGFSGALSMEKP